MMRRTSPSSEQTSSTQCSTSIHTSKRDVWPKESEVTLWNKGNPYDDTGFDEFKEGTDYSSSCTRFKHMHAWPFIHVSLSSCTWRLCIIVALEVSRPLNGYWAQFQSACNPIMAWVSIHWHSICSANTYLALLVLWHSMELLIMHDFLVVHYCQLWSCSCSTLFEEMLIVPHNHFRLCLWEVLRQHVWGTEPVIDSD